MTKNADITLMNSHDKLFLTKTICKFGEGEPSYLIFFTNYSFLCQISWSNFSDTIKGNESHVSKILQTSGCRDMNNSLKFLNKVV